MTCIVGFVHKREVWIGGDSQGTAGYRKLSYRSPKVFRNGPYLFGCCGSYRMAQLLNHAFTPPEHPVDMPVEKFMATRFIDAVRTCFKDGGVAEKENEVESCGTFLAGYRGRLFRIDSDYQASEPMNGFEAIGCGDEFALGALHVAHAFAPENKAKAALSAAEAFSTGCSGPFVILSISKDAK